MSKLKLKYKVGDKVFLLVIMRNTKINYVGFLL